MGDKARGAVSAGSACACIACQPRLCGFVQANDTSVTPRHFTIQRGERLECLSGNCLKFWSVVRGTAAVCTVLEDGRRQIISLAGPNAVVCGLLADGATPHWLEAMEPCEICEIDFTPRAALLAQDASFMRVIMDIMHDQLVQSSRHLTTLGRLDSTERVILFMGQMALRPEMRDGQPVALPMSREDIADYLGLNAETVSRILTKMRKSGLIKFLSRSEFVVADIRALQRRLPVPLTRADTPVIEQFAQNDCNCGRCNA